MFNRVLIREYNFHLTIYFFFPFPGGGDPGGILGLASMSNLETAQVQIKLRYSVADALLHVGIERARNLAALFIPENRKM